MNTIGEEEFRPHTQPKSTAFMRCLEAHCQHELQGILCLLLVFFFFFFFISFALFVNFGTNKTWTASIETKEKRHTRERNQQSRRYVRVHCRIAMDPCCSHANFVQHCQYRKTHSLTTNISQMDPNEHELKPMCMQEDGRIWTDNTFYDDVALNSFEF